MRQALREQAKVKGFGTIKKILHEVLILHEGWDTDNFAWIVEMEDGSTVALTTSHGGVYLWRRDDAEAQLAEAEKSVASIRAALAMWPNSRLKGK